MTVLVTQPNNEYASQQVNVFADDHLAGCVGPGESLTIKSDTSPCRITAKCGFSTASVNIMSDRELHIRWSVNASMELILVPR